MILKVGEISLTIPLFSLTIYRTAEKIGLLFTNICCLFSVATENRWYTQFRINPAVVIYKGTIYKDRIRYSFNNL